MSIDSRLPMFRSMTPAERLGHLQELLELARCRHCAPE